MSVSIQLSAESAAEMNRAIQRLGEVAGKTAEEVITSQARLFCTDLAFCTRPLGKGPGVGKLHAARIESKIRDIYWTVGEAVEAVKKAGGKKIYWQFLKAIRRKNYPQAEAILYRTISGSRWTVGPFDGGSLHAAQRFRRKLSERMVVLDKGPLTEYRRREVAQSGFAKAGFAKAAKDLGGSRGIPGFATRHTNAPGKGQANRSGDQITVTIENHVRHIEKAFDSSLEAAATEARKNKITALIKRILTNRAKQASPSLK